MRWIKAISQAKQGDWMRWESVEQCKMCWQDLWYTLKKLELKVVPWLVIIGEPLLSLSNGACRTIRGGIEHVNHHREPLKYH